MVPSFKKSKIMGDTLEQFLSMNVLFESGLGWREWLRPGDIISCMAFAFSSHLLGGNNMDDFMALSMGVTKDRPGALFQRWVRLEGCGSPM